MLLNNVHICSCTQDKRCKVLTTPFRCVISMQPILTLIGKFSYDCIHEYDFVLAPIRKDFNSLVLEITYNSVFVLMTYDGYLHSPGSIAPILTKQYLHSKYDLILVLFLNFDFNLLELSQI